MKRLWGFCLLVAVLLVCTVCTACAAQSATQGISPAETIAPAQTSESEPTATPEPTPVPTPEPRVISFSPNTEISKSKTISIIVKDVSYTQNHSIDLTLSITNNDVDNWTFDTFYGSVNGWGFPFLLKNDYLSLDAGRSADAELTAPLSPALDAMLSISDLKSITLAISGYSALGYLQDFGCDPLENPACAADYVQAYPTIDSAVYESKTMRIGLQQIDWDSRLVYLYVDNLVSKNIFLNPLYPAVNGYCSEDVSLNGYLPGDHGKTILTLDLSAIAEQYGMDQLKKLAVSGSWTNKIGYSGYGFGDYFAFSVPFEDGDEQFTPEYDTTGDVWLDNEIVTLVYRGVAETMYGDDGVQLLLVNKTENKPLLIDSQQTLYFGEDRPWIFCNTIVSPGSACIITLSLYSMTGQPIFPEDVPITGSLKINSSGFSTVATAKVNQQPKG